MAGTADNPQRASSPPTAHAERKQRFATVSGIPVERAYTADSRASAPPRGKPVAVRAPSVASSTASTSAAHPKSRA